MTAVLGLLLALAAVLANIPTPVRVIHSIENGGNSFEDTSFTSDGFSAETSGLPRRLEVRGSYVGGDTFQGTYRSPWYPVAPKVIVMIAGYPTGPGNSLMVEEKDRKGKIHEIAYAGFNPREYWRPWEIHFASEAEAFRIIAKDGSSDFFGWLAVSQPVQGDLRPRFHSQASRSLLAFGIQGLLLATIASAAWSVALRNRFELPEFLHPMSAGIGLAVLSYLAFWIYFFSPLWGRIFSWVVSGLSVGVATGFVFKSKPSSTNESWSPVFFLTTVIGAGVVAFTTLYDGGAYSFLASNRFVDNLPADNQIPALFADRLWLGLSPRKLIGDWLSSDRPPLQTGWLLLARPILEPLGFDNDTLNSAGGIWFQLLWIPALWALCRRLEMNRMQSSALIAGLSFSCIFFFYTAYTWPKFGAGALVLTAFILWFLTEEAEKPRISTFCLGAIAAALGWLSHGGIAFSLLGLLPILLVRWQSTYRNRRYWLIAASVFLLLILPWTAYQRFYEPPGNRLFKWHLAGVIPQDNRGFVQALVESYRAAGFKRTLQARANNFSRQFTGNWTDLFSFSSSTRPHQLAFTARAFGVWVLGAIAVPWALIKSKGIKNFAMLCLSWLACGWLIWIALMFLPDSARIHQGTLVTQLLGFTFLSWALLRVNKVAFSIVAVFSAGSSIMIWLPPTQVADGKLNPLATIVSLSAGAILLSIVAYGALRVKGRQKAENR